MLVQLISSELSGHVLILSQTNVLFKQIFVTAQMNSFNSHTPKYWIDYFFNIKNLFFLLVETFA